MEVVVTCALFLAVVILVLLYHFQCVTCTSRCPGIQIEDGHSNAEGNEGNNASHNAAAIATIFRDNPA